MNVNILLSVLTVMMMVFSSCNENEDYIPTNEREEANFTIYASNAHHATKSVLSGMDVLWSQNDVIGVFTDETLNASFVNQNTTTKESATFVGNLQGNKTEGVAYFPYANDVRLNNNILTLTLPNKQIFESNSTFNSKANIAVAKGNLNEDLVFENLCGVVKINLTGEKIIKSIRFQADQICGKASINLTDNTLSLIENVGNEVELTDINQMLTSTPKSYYIVLPAARYAHFTVKVTDSDDNEFECVSTKELVIKRSVITSLASLNVVFKEPELKADTLWVKGINPPKDKWKFIQDGSYEMEYMYAYENCGWYDIDKQYLTNLPINVIDGIYYGPDDYYLCWAASASNICQYMLDRSKEKLKQLPGFVEKDWRFWLTSSLGSNSHGHISEIMEQFKSKYSDTGAVTEYGYTDFFTGYNKMPGYLKGFVKDSYIDNSIHKLMYPTRAQLTDAIKKGIKDEAGFFFSVQMPGNVGHAITAWGATFREDGLVDKIYITNSDDTYGLHTFKLRDYNGKVAFELNKDSETVWKINYLLTYDSLEKIIDQQIADNNSK